LTAALIVSPETTETCTANMLTKLQTQDCTQAAVIELHLGLVNWTRPF
jgi:hypothetical protein